MYRPVTSSKPRISHGHEMRNFSNGEEEIDPRMMPSPYNSGVKPRRDHRGNLVGGEQNMSMQKYQQCESLEEKEHKRWLAHKDAALAATFPKSLELNGITVPIFKVEELEPLGANRLKQRALNMRDLLTASKSRFFEHYPHLALNANAPEEVVMKWMIDVQVTLASAMGMEDLDHAAFGASSAPTPWQRQQAAPSAQQYRPAPVWSQEGINDGRQPEARARPQTRSSSPPRDFPWSQHGINDERMGSWREAPPSHQGFSLVPPHLQSGGDAMGRNDDAWAIRCRGHNNSFVIG